MRPLWSTTVFGAVLGAGLMSGLLPSLASACPVCGGAENNGYFWGVLFLMSMPFAIGSLIGGWLLYSYHRASAGPMPSTPPPAIADLTTQPSPILLASDRPAPPQETQHQGYIRQA
jgi:hypothetical protein